MKLNKAQTIVDMDLFIKSHTSIVEATKTKKVYQPYRDRLELILSKINNEGNIT